MPGTILNGERDRHTLHRDHLGDQGGDVGDRAAELPGKDLQQGLFLLGGRLVIDIDDGLPVPGQDIARNMDREGEGAAGDIHAFDVPLSTAQPKTESQVPPSGSSPIQHGHSTLQVQTSSSLPEMS